MADRRLSGLKIHRHPRGHVADCNGSIETIGANIESYRDYSNTNNAEVSCNHSFSEIISNSILSIVLIITV